MAGPYRIACLLGLAFASSCASTSGVPAAKQSVPDQIRAFGRELTALLYAGDASALEARLDEPMRLLLRDVPAFVQSFNRGFGAELEMLEERVIPWLSGGVYVRRARYAEQSLIFDLYWTTDGGGRVIGLHYRPAPTEAPGPHESYATASHLRLPFEDDWYVYWGGRSVAENYHVEARDQRYAYDFVVVHEGSTHRKDGSANAHYYAFGRPIVAPAGGMVVAMTNDVPDNRPGLMNALQPLGNHVVIAHGNGEFSFMAHFQRGTVLVRSGEIVARGQVLARCGNSGNSSEPHLHYHLQDTSTFGKGDGLPAQFEGFALDGQPTLRGEPTRGRMIEHLGDIFNIHEPMDDS
jgi:hypothetical protein